ncbi:MAG: ABC transporter substrate-binding protein [Polyangiaceae bacterium]|nr:ABC transporter substrate-binding protein [Polyangiaceae bacterium]NUQ77463.1 ABC transporter substrate-binding protein [Polyangiaceae bacterium]
MVKKSASLGSSRTRAFTQCAGLLLAAGLLTGLPSCSFVVDTNANQCEADADCPAGATCDVAQKLCVAGGTQQECTTNQDCISKDPNTICRKSDFTCVLVRTPECATVDGDLSRDDAFMFGSVLPLTGPDEIFGKPVELAIQLALADIKNELTGIPSSTVGVNRPLVYIGCDDKSDLTDETQVKAAKHLAEELQVPAIIGEAFSGSTITIAQEVTIKNGTLLISPAATSDTITTLIDDDLVWRTSPPDTLQAAALKLYVPEVEIKVRSDFDALMIPINTPVKVGLIHNTDSYGKGLADAIVSELPTPLIVNGKSLTDPMNMANFSRRQYEEMDTNEQQAIATDMATVFHPQIIMMFGFSEAISILSTIESKWNGGNPRPRYVLPDGLLVGELSAAVGNDSDLRKRISGTIPGTINPQFTTFVGNYEFKWSADAKEFPATTFGAAGGYDSVFLLAYATATLGENPETGKNLAAGLKQLSNPMGPVINAGAKSIPAGFSAIRDTGGIDYNGASGPLNFDPKTGEAQSDIQIWCLPVGQGGMGTGSGINSGLYYEAASGKLAGSFGIACD